MDLSVFVLSIAAAVIGGLIIVEIAAWSPKISTAITKWAAAKMPFPVRARFREEWQAYLADMPTGISQLVASLGFALTAHRTRVGAGLEMLVAVRDYFRLRRGMRAYLAEARAFGGCSLGLHLVMQPCGNRHVVLTALFPVTVIPFLDDYNETLRLEAADKNLDLSDLRMSIVCAAQDAVDEAPDRGAQSVRLRSHRLTNRIFPSDRDARPIRMLLAVLERLRFRRIRRQFAIVNAGSKVAEDCGEQ